MYNVSCCFPLTTGPSPYYTVFVHSFVHIYMYFHRYDNVTLSPLLLQHLLVFRDCLYSRWFFFNIFRSFLLTHGMLFRDLISLFGMLLFMVPNRCFLKISQSWCTSSPFFCFSSTISFSVFISLFIVFQLALL
jgi:hypothetical protein